MTFRAKTALTIAILTAIALGGAFTAVSAAFNGLQRRQLDASLRSVAAQESARSASAPLLVLRKARCRCERRGSANEVRHHLRREGKADFGDATVRRQSAFAQQLAQLRRASIRPMVWRQPLPRRPCRDSATSGQTAVSSNVARRPRRRRSIPIPRDASGVFRRRPLGSGGFVLDGWATNACSPRYCERSTASDRGRSLGARPGQGK